LIAGAAKIGGISYFHAFAYDLLADNERIMANTCDAAIEAYKKEKLEKVTYLSSSMVFENASSWPSKEGDQLMIPPPSSAYGFQKLAVEYFARAAWDQYQLPFTILRFFNCVGIGESRAINAKSIFSGNVQLAMSHVLPDLIQKTLKSQNPLRILGAGNQVRHYTYGGDLAKGIVLALEKPLANNEDFNISTSTSMTVIELAKIVWRKINGEDTKFSFISEDPYPHDVQKRIPDTTKAKEILGFEAETPIEQVIDEVIPWIKEAIAKKII
jgi:nucleoside-diphosphate-sugar epimerase